MGTMGFSEIKTKLDELSIRMADADSISELLESKSGKKTILIRTANGNWTLSSRAQEVVEAVLADFVNKEKQVVAAALEQMEEAFGGAVEPVAVEGPAS